MKWPPSLPLVLLAPLCFTLPPVGGRTAAADCDRVLCYFAGSETKVEWRIYDPARGTDRTFLTGRPPYHDCRDELWQSSRNAMDWHLVIADTEDCSGWYEGDFHPSFESDPRGGSRMRRVPTVTPDNLTHVLSPESEGAESVESSLDCEFALYYVPSRTIPQRGTIFRYCDCAPESPRTLHPIYLADREHGTRRLLCGPESCPQEISGNNISEECGLLMVACRIDTTTLVDIRTGRDVTLAGSSIGCRQGGLVEGVYAFWGPPLKR